MLITSKSVINGEKRDTDLLTENFMPLPPNFLWQPAGKQKLWGKPRKRLCIKNKEEYGISIKVKALNQSLIRSESS